VVVGGLPEAVMVGIEGYTGIMVESGQQLVKVANITVGPDLFVPHNRLRRLSLSSPSGAYLTWFKRTDEGETFRLQRDQTEPAQW